VKTVFWRGTRFITPKVSENRLEGILKTRTQHQAARTPPSVPDTSFFAETEIIAR